MDDYEVYMGIAEVLTTVAVISSLGLYISYQIKSHKNTKNNKKSNDLENTLETSSSQTY